MRMSCVLGVMFLAGCSQPNDENSQAWVIENAAVTESVVTEPQKPAIEPAVTPEVDDGRCGMEECSYSKELAREVVGGGANGRLVKVTLLGGSSSREGSAITWNKTPHDLYVYCSTMLPVVMMQTDQAWQVDSLDFINGVPGVLESSQSIYAKTCHKDDKAFPDDAKSLGYTEIPEEKQDITIKKPSDIFAISETIAQ
jgi:hypothetical protein